MRSRTRARVLILALPLLASCSSKKKSQPIAVEEVPSVRAIKDAPQELMVLRQVLVEEDSTQGVLTLHSKEVAKKLGGLLVTSGYLAARDGDVPDTQHPRRVEGFLTMSYDWAPEAGALVLAAEARLEFVKGRDDLAPRAAVLMEALVPTADAAQQALETLESNATVALAETLVAQERLRLAPHAELLSALSIGLHEPSMRIWALRLAADRSLVEAVPAAMDALEAEDADVQAAAIATLVALGDPRAVPALVKDADFNNYEELGVRIEAVAAIGGEDAIEFLEFVASGHSNPAIQEQAKSSLARLRSGVTGGPSVSNRSPL